MIHAQLTVSARLERDYTSNMYYLWFSLVPGLHVRKSGRIQLSLSTVNNTAWELG